MRKRYIYINRITNNQIFLMCSFDRKNPYEFFGCGEKIKLGIYKIQGATEESVF